NYKNQVLDSLQNEHAAIIQEVHKQEDLIESIKNQYKDCCQELKNQQMQGVTAIQIYTYENYLDVLTYKIKKEQEVLLLLRKKEEMKRSQVVEAKKESASIEKLKEKKVALYNRELQKENELLIEEFVANGRNRRQNQSI
ncbi:MAG: flagellar FliJ family protein, partial [Hungatella sp.]